MQEIRSGGTPGGPAGRAGGATPAARGPTHAADRVHRKEREVAEIERTAARSSLPLAAIVAAGGMGETRVAAEVARRLADDHRDGVFFVALEAARSAGQAVTAVADAMALAFFGPRTPLDQLLDHLADKRVLVVLDNFEHLLDDPEGTELVTGLLARGPGASVLTTSRERLNLRAEWVHDLDPMELPGNEDAQRDADAVVLFLQSALRAGVDAEPDLRDVVRVCRLTGGMPLALELAASWLRGPHRRGDRRGARRRHRPARGAPARPARAAPQPAQHVRRVLATTLGAGERGPEAAGDVPRGIPTGGGAGRGGREPAAPAHAGQPVVPATGRDRPVHAAPSHVAVPPSRGSGGRGDPRHGRPARRLLRRLPA
ncbi:MAG: hypothetical protein U5J97_11375 [Trueperaceae bacterium]|nr:hypothetical protein [Trueperaceae bacterium]